MIEPQEEKLWSLGEQVKHKIEQLRIAIDANSGLHKIRRSHTQLQQKMLQLGEQLKQTFDRDDLAAWDSAGKIDCEASQHILSHEFSYAKFITKSSESTDGKTAKSLAKITSAIAICTGASYGFISAFSTDIPFVQQHSQALKISIGSIVAAMVLITIVALIVAINAEKKHLEGEVNENPEPSDSALRLT